MKKVYWVLLFVSIAVIFWFDTEPAYCQSSPSYQLEWAILDGGGGIRNSTNYDVRHSIGQPAGGMRSLSGSYVNTSGLYAGNRMPGTQIPPITPDTDVPDPASVPEPSTLFLVGVGIFGILALGRKRQKG